MPDFDKLKSLNLENIDAAVLTKALTDHQNTLIKAALVIGSVILAVMIFNDFQTKDRDLHTQITQMKAKIEAIKAHDDAAQNLKDFTSALPKKLNEVELISLISNYAKSCHVTITSLTPAESKDMVMYDLINAKFNAEADDFKTMMLFLRKIEKSKYPLRIETWNGHETDDGRAIFSIEINVVLIHQ